MSTFSHREWWSCSLSRASLSLVELGRSLPRIRRPSCTPGPEVAARLVSIPTYISFPLGFGDLHGSARCPLTSIAPILPSLASLALALLRWVPCPCTSCVRPALYAPRVRSHFAGTTCCLVFPSCSPVVRRITPSASAQSKHLAPNDVFDVMSCAPSPPSGSQSPSSDVLHVLSYCLSRRRSLPLRVMCSPVSVMSAIRRSMPNTRVPSTANCWLTTDMPVNGLDGRLGGEPQRLRVQAALRPTPRHSAFWPHYPQMLEQPV